MFQYVESISDDAEDSMNNYELQVWIKIQKIVVTSKVQGGGSNWEREFKTFITSSNRSKSRTLDKL